MALPLAAIGTGLSVLGSVKGLLGGNAAAKRAMEAQEQALREMAFGDAMEADAIKGGGIRGLFDLQGRLNDALMSGSRGMGAALAAGGVHNSSAHAGAVANQGAANAAELGRYSSGLSDTLARLGAQSRSRVGSARLGLETNRYNDARDQQRGSMAGLSSLLGSLSQFNLRNNAADFGRKVGDVGYGDQNGTPSVLPTLASGMIPNMTPRLIMPKKSLFSGNPLAGSY